MVGKRPGYKREPTLYKLTFEDDAFDGLEVLAKSLPLGDFLHINRLAADMDGDLAKQAEQAELMIRKFSDALVSWNLLDEHDQPVEATYEGLAGQETPFVMEIIRAWMDAVAGVPKPSPAGLNGGGTYPEVSLPMAPLSPSPQN